MLLYGVYNVVIILANKDNLMLDFFLDAQEYNKSETVGNSGNSEVERVFSAIQANLNEQLVRKVRFGILF